jgi:hypothetical protein
MMNPPNPPTIPEFIARIAAISRLVDGLAAGSVLEHVPRILNERTLPILLWFPGPLDRTAGRESASTGKVQRTFIGELYLARIPDGAEGTAQEIALDYNLENLLYAEFDGRRRLGLADNGLGGVDALLEGDEGLGYLNFPRGSANWYYGFSFRLQVSFVRVSPNKEHS